MIWRRTILVVLSGLLLLLAAGCGTDTLEVTLSWSYGDMDLAIQGPDGVTYTAKSAANPCGFFSADEQDGGSETFTLWPFVHESGRYDVGYDCIEQDIPYTMTVTRNGITTTCPGSSYAGGGWVDPYYDIRQNERPQ